MTKILLILYHGDRDAVIVISQNSDFVVENLVSVTETCQT